MKPRMTVLEKASSKLPDQDQDQRLCAASQAVREQNMVMDSGTKNDLLVRASSNLPD
jgi:hypothetical protein